MYYDRLTSEIVMYFAEMCQASPLTDIKCCYVWCEQWAGPIYACVRQYEAKARNSNLSYRATSAIQTSIIQATKLMICICMVSFGVP